MSPSFLPGASHPQVASTDGKDLVLSQLSPSDSNYKLWHNTTADHGASDKCNMLLPVRFNQALPVKHAELFYGTTMTTFHLNQRNVINHRWPMW